MVNLRAIQWIQRQYRELSKVGPSAYTTFKSMRFRSCREVTLHPGSSRHPVYCRPKSSDRRVFGQIFLDEEYRCLAGVPDSGGLILDLGANVGHSASYLLTRFSASKLIAIEPDPANFEILKRTLSPYCGRAKVINSGVWSHSCGLVLDERYNDEGDEWARQVRPARSGEIPQMQAVDVFSLLKDSGYDRIFLLKVDVEGAEEQVFDPSSAAWIDRVDNIVIELHGEDRAQVFHKAVARQNFEISRCDELTVCRRR